MARPTTRARSKAVQEIYIGTGVAALASRPRGHADAGVSAELLALRDVDAFYGKSHIVRAASLDRARARDRRAARPQWRRQVDAAEDDHRHRAAQRQARSRSAGDDVAARPAAEIARRGIGYVPQGRALFAGMSVRHNLELGRLKRQCRHRRPRGPTSGF